MKQRQRFEYFFAVLIMLGLFLGSIFFTNYFFKKELLIQQENYLKKESLLITQQLSDQAFSDKTLNSTEKKFVQQFATDENERLTLMDESGIIFFDSSGNDLIEDSRKSRPEIQAVLSGASHGSSIRKSETLKRELLYLALPIEKNKKRIGILRIAEEATQFSQSIQSFQRYIIFTFGLLFLIISIFVLLLLRQKNKPLITVLPVLKRILKHPNENRSIIQNSPEWNELYQTVNLLSQQMSQTYRAYTSTDEQFHALLDELMIGVFIIDVNGNIELINPKMLAILGIETSYPYKQKNYLELIQEPQLIHLIHQVIAEKAVIHKEIKISSSSQEVILDTTLRFIEEDGNNYQVMGIAYDLTRVRQLEAMQKDFVSNVSHELKTPVTSLLGFTETLLDGAKDDPKTLKKFLEIMEKDARRLQQLIQEILQLSHDGKNISYHVQKMNIYPFIEELLRSYEKMITEKQLTILITGDRKATYLTKYELFYPIVKNLVENAIQYSSTGGKIIIAFSQEKEFIFTVEDNGIGITQKDQERIFERFYRVDKARSRHSGGTGLGLSIVQNYTELLGGTISLESHLGLGSTFIVQLPIGKEKIE